MKEIFDNLIDVYKEVYSSKIFYRKIRVKGKIKRRYMYTYNTMRDILPSPSFINFMLKKLNRRKI